MVRGPPGGVRRREFVMHALPEKEPSKRQQKALLLGVGLDAQDGHVRITKGDNFRLVGGSEDTHGQMTETVTRFNEKLKERGKTLETVEREEFSDLMHDSMS